MSFWSVKTLKFIKYFKAVDRCVWSGGVDIYVYVYVYFQ